MRETSRRSTPTQAAGARPRPRAAWLLAVALTCVAVLASLPEAAVAQDETFDLSDTEVARLFDRAMPALSERTTVPAITGSASADARIAEVALSRGYLFRGAPLDTLGSYQGRRLQQRAIGDLILLQDAMLREAGVTLTLTSAYRGVASQRNIFVSRLAAASISLRGRRVSNAEIGRGTADDVLHRVMATAAPPGFSKHHTGYAIDVSSGGLGGFSFRQSAAWRWLTQNDFENAMRFGWVPSYPDAAAAQGPNPEPWEWVWIGQGEAACARTRACPRGNLELVSARRDLVAGWASTADGERVGRLRLVSERGNQRLLPFVVPRLDIEAALGVRRRVGFLAEVKVRSSVEWACVEARTVARGPWARVGCLQLD